MTVPALQKVLSDNRRIMGRALCSFFVLALTVALGSCAGNSDSAPPPKANYGYTLLLRGFDPNGKPMALAGILLADNHGSILGGELDLNDAGQITHVPSPVTGSYTTSSSFGGILRGETSITTNFKLPGTNIPLGLKFVFNNGATQGRIIEFDNSGFSNSGIVYIQEPTAIEEANPVGNFAFGLDSDAPMGARTVAAGEFEIVNQLQRAPNGGIAGGLVDQSNTCAPAPTYCTSPIAAGLATGPDAFGRGTLTLNAGGTPAQFAFYVVNAGEMFLMEIDSGAKPGTLLAGVARQQATFNMNSPNTTAVLQMTGLDTVQGGDSIAPDVIIGAMSIIPGGSFTLTFDTNDAGSVQTGQQVAGSVLSFDPSSGRGVISIAGGFSSGFMDTAIFYLYSSGEGFLIDADPASGGGAVNKGLSGNFILQSAGPFSNETLGGQSLVGSGGSSTAAIPNAEGAAVFDSNDGTFSAIGDLTSILKGDGNVTNGSFNGTFQVSDPVMGHGTAMVSAELFGNFTQGLLYPATFYIVAPNQFVLIGTQRGSSSGVTYFDPQ